MSKEYFILQNGRVVYEYGHYDLEGAETIAKRIIKSDPTTEVTIVKIVSIYVGVNK